MKVLYGIRNLKKGYFKKPVVCIGIFDGVHIGHRDIIKKIIRKALKIKGTSVLVTFYPHPHSVLSSDQRAGLLISLPHRLRLIEQLGIDVCIVINFNKEFASMKAEVFVKNFLVDKIGTKEIVVGSDFLFGRKKTGDVNLLKDLASGFGFLVDVVELTRYKGGVVSSTRIRSLIEKGAFEEAECLLGRPVSILGSVIKGTKRGRLIGYPTANIDPHHEVIPPKGVYAVLIKLDDKVYKGVLNIGIRPTFSKFPPKCLAGSPRSVAKKEELTVEAHVFGFNNKIYGKDIEVSFIKKIRDEKRFQDKSGLIQQIKQDELVAKSILR